MNATHQKRLTVVWLGLSLITLLSWWLGSRHGQGAIALNAGVTFGVMLISAIKVRVILRQFMEVRHAPKLLRYLTDTWLVLVFVILLGIYSTGLIMRA